nr:alpha/beta hydrolase [Corynebacterium mendelii]
MIVLICHGYGEHLGRFAHVAEFFRDQGAAVFAIDHRGHGRSAGEKVLVDDFDELVDDFRLLTGYARDKFPDLDVALVGHSMGGMLSVRYAQRFPDDLAAVVVTGPVIGQWDPGRVLAQADPVPEIPVDPGVLSRDAGVGQAYMSDPLVWHGSFHTQTILAFVEMIGRIDAAGTVEVPMLWMHGTADQLVPYEGTKKGWEKIAKDSDRHIFFDGARHELFNETNKQEVVDHALAFINDHI